jgi:hypothetical protein
MTSFDPRTTTNLEVALERVCHGLPGGGDHETRKRVAEKLLQAAEGGHKSLGELEAVGRQALHATSRRSA